jgi:MoxR-like ATPase
MVALMGPKKNGALDLLKAIKGVSTPSTGTILWQGTDASQFRSMAPHRISLCTAELFPDEDDSLHNCLSSTFVEYGDVPEETAAIRVGEVLEETRLSALQHTPVRQLSALQRAKAALASCLLRDAELILCDALTPELSSEDEATFLNLLKAVSGRGKTVIFQTDVLKDLSMPDSVIVLHEGQLAFHARPEFLLHYFDILTPAQLAEQLKRRTGEEWAHSWRKHRSAFYRTQSLQPPGQRTGPNERPKTALLNSDPLPDDDSAKVAFLVEMHRRIRAEIGKLIVGQEEVIEQLLIAILAGGHCLLEGVPGLAKTAVVRSLAKTMQLSFRRIQFTPDLMPADVTGTDILQEDPATGRRSLVFQKGPIFSQMLLADEINRTPAKTQAALLEAMQEHSVTAGGHTAKLEQPFFVLATQNPIEQEGTYPLPEAQKDRFLFHVRVGYPDRQSERIIIERTTGDYEADIQPVISGPQIIQCQKTARRVPVPDHVMDFVLDLIRSTRPDEEGASTFVKESIAWGAGPRACQCLVSAGKVRAVLRGRVHVSIEDIEALALPVLRHRIVPTFQAEAEGLSADAIVLRLLASTRRPSDQGLL